jgi:cytochrome d ubiquinol oxidase subunit I
MLRFIFLSFPLGFIATLMGWFTAEVGRQPWVVYGLLRTADAATPFLIPQQVAFSLALFAAIYFAIFLAGITFIFRLLRAGPGAAKHISHAQASASRPMAFGTVSSAAAAIDEE